MPTYEYRCEECEHIFEVFHGINENPQIACPECGDPDGVERLISAGAGLIFKGSGFYITDYKKKNSVTSPANKSNGNGKSKSKTTTETSPSKE
jgi:putative FmdB family regulatory protein